MSGVRGRGWDGDVIGDGDGARCPGEVCKIGDNDGIHSQGPRPRFRTDIQENADTGKTSEGTSILI